MTSVKSHKGLFSSLRPDLIVKGALDIPFEKLQEEGYKAALLDYDNTIGPDRTWEPSDYSRQVIDKLNSLGYKICLVSNAKSNRSANIAKILDIPCVTCAHKPSTKGLVEASKILDVELDKCLMIGDQLFTDIAAGNNAGSFSILVEPYASKEVWYVKIKRPLEKIVRFFMKF